MSNGAVQISVDPEVREAVKRIEAKLVELEDTLERIEAKLEKTNESPPMPG